MWKGLCAISSSPYFNGTNTHLSQIRAFVVDFGPFISQILLRQMQFDSDFTQISAQKNDEWSLCLYVVFPFPRLQRGTILTNPGPLEENAIAHIMTQQNTQLGFKLSLTSVRGMTSRNE